VRVRLGLAGLLAFAVALEVAPRTGLVPATYAPPTSRIALALGRELRVARFWSALWDTLRTWTIGLLIAALAGIVLGLFIGMVPLLRTATASTVEFLRPIPSVALIPLVVLIYGARIQATLVLVVYAAFWQVLVQVLHGVADVDPVAADTARSFRLGPLARVWYLVLPTALPYTLTGLRLAASVALILTITGELVIGSPGLGQQISIAQSSNAVPSMYALVLVTGLLGVGANLLARLVEWLLLRWHPAQRAELARAEAAA
jgi:ABC-type nitrate/sulfonate/bicarbonate transport system permease component